MHTNPPDGPVMWLWDGNLKKALAMLRGREHELIIERGVLVEETEDVPYVNNLLKGDVVYRLVHVARLKHALAEDRFFSWHLLDSTGKPVRRAAF